MRILGALPVLVLVVLGACAPAAAPAFSPLTDAAARSMILQHQLTDVRTGTPFQLGQFGGVTVVVNAAMW